MTLQKVLLHLAMGHRAKINILYVTASYELGQEQKANNALWLALGIVSFKKFFIWKAFILLGMTLK